MDHKQKISSVLSLKFDLDDDGAFCVDKNMKTTIDDIYAAGDVCAVRWNESQHWFQVCG
jgi:thioredoxin reductase